MCVQYYRTQTQSLKPLSADHYCTINDGATVSIFSMDILLTTIENDLRQITMHTSVTRVNYFAFNL